ncbi:MAG: zeta toxin family protein [Oligoflexales bacterium]
MLGAKNLPLVFLRNINLSTALILCFLTFENLYASNYLEDFFSCIDANRKWDFEESRCLPGRNWKKAPGKLLSELDRPLLQDEVEKAVEVMKMKSKKTIAKTAKPKAILIIGAGGSGKSFLCDSLGQWFPSFKLEEYIQFDGDILRQFHRGFLEAAKNPSIGYLDAWKVLKPHIYTTKDNIFDLVISERRNVIIPTNVHAQKYFKLMLQNGYDVKIVGLYVDFKTALYRGKNRAEWTGRVYLGTEKEWRTGIEDMYSLASNQNTLSSIILDNSDFDKPRVLFRKPLLSQN